jgi:radical SAM-linked protein
MEKILYRAIFCKKDLSSFLSHLDVMRTFTRAFKRAKIPVWYSHGFTQRPHLEFPLPLPLGVSSDKEIMDFALSDNIECDGDMVNVVNSVLPNGLQIIELSQNITDTSKIDFAKYILYLPDNINRKSIENYISQDSIEVEKFSKSKGVITIDIKPHLYIDGIDDIDITHQINATLPVGSKLNINVNVLINSIAAFTLTKSEIICAKRIDYLLNNGEQFV